jgi:glycosyltransferase involved in cell wall biosynthesis
VPVIKKNVESKTRKTISIITATYNASENISQLIKSLQAQTDSEFEWVIADGESDDDTLSIINNVPDLNIKLDSKKDFGIYDALNRAVSVCSTDFYVVLGADDILYKDAISQFKKKIEENPGASFYCFSLNEGGRKIKKPKKGLFWLYGLGGECSGHAVSLLIRRSVHEKIGLYSKRYSICADQHLIGRAIYEGVPFVRSDVCVGLYGTDGFSAQNRLAGLCESFLVKYEICSIKSVQIILFIIRLIKFSFGGRRD